MIEAVSDVDPKHVYDLWTVRVSAGLPTWQLNNDTMKIVGRWNLEGGRSDGHGSKRRTSCGTFGYSHPSTRRVVEFDDAKNMEYGRPVSVAVWPLPLPSSLLFRSHPFSPLFHSPLLDSISFPFLSITNHYYHYHHHLLSFVFSCFSPALPFFFLLLLLFIPFSSLASYINLSSNVPKSKGIVYLDRPQRGGWSWFSPQGGNFYHLSASTPGIIRWIFYSRDIRVPLTPYLVVSSRLFSLPRVSSFWSRGSCSSLGVTTGFVELSWWTLCMCVLWLRIITTQSYQILRFFFLRLPSGFFLGTSRLGLFLYDFFLPELGEAYSGVTVTCFSWKRWNSLKEVVS